VLPRATTSNHEYPRNTSVSSPVNAQLMPKSDWVASKPARVAENPVSQMRSHSTLGKARLEGRAEMRPCLVLAFGSLRSRCGQTRFDQLSKGVRQDSITVLRSVLVAKSRRCRGVTRSVHQFGRCGACSSGQSETSMPKVMEPQIRPPDGHWAFSKEPCSASLVSSFPALPLKSGTAYSDVPFSSSGQE
jgi:hypothetical protein